MTAHLDGPQVWEVRFGEAQGTVDDRGGVAGCGERLADGLGLAIESVEVSGSVSSADVQQRWLEPAGPDFDLPGDGFGVDDVDAGGDNRDVVDVAATAGHPAVVDQHAADLRHGLLDRRRDVDLALLALAEGLLVLGLGVPGQQQAANVGVSLADASFAVGATAPVLAAEARSGLSAVDLGRGSVIRGSVDGVALAGDARDRASAPIPPRLHADGEFGAAAGAQVSPAQL